MEKIHKLEELALSLFRYKGVRACAVASRLGPGEILYDSNIGEVDRTLLSTVVSSLLLIGEKLGQELGSCPADYHLMVCGQSNILAVPGDENVALMVLFEGSDERDAIIGASRETAANMGELLRNKAAGV